MTRPKDRNAHHDHPDAEPSRPGELDLSAWDRIEKALVEVEAGARKAWREGYIFGLRQSEVYARFRGAIEAADDIRDCRQDAEAEWGLTADKAVSS